MRSSSFIVLALAGCAAPRDPAPEDLDGLVRFMFVNWEDQDRLDDAMVNLAPWLETEGMGEKAAEEGYLLTDLSADEVAVVPHPDTDLGRMVGVAVAGVSPYPVRDHAALITLEDQVWNDPTAHNRYDREITAGDRDRFIDGDDVLLTLNDIDKKGAFGVNIPYILNKDFRWATVDADRRAVVARSFVAERSCSESGENCIQLSFSVDLWYGNAEDSTIRMTASWNDIVTSVDSVVGDDLKVKMMVSGINDIFSYTDEKIAADGAPDGGTGASGGCATVSRVSALLAAIGLLLARRRS